MNSRFFFLQAAGSLACFTRPELKAERVSYEVITPSAARGIFDAIFWKPAILWRIHAIWVLNPIKWISVRRNEVLKIGAANNVTGFCIEDERAQRASLLLKDVDYLIEGSFELTKNEENEDRARWLGNVRKFEEMFSRRAAKGQFFSMPYLGCREFSADVLLIEDDRVDSIKNSAEKITKPLGRMLLDIRNLGTREKPEYQPYWFEAELKNGCMLIPEVPHAN